MSWSIVSNVLNMYAAPHTGAEVVSQGCFSEPVRIDAIMGDWAKITTEIDGYTGWVNRTGICERSERYTSGDSVWVNRLAAHVYSVKDTIYGPLITLPYSCRLVLTQPITHDRWLNVLLPDGKEAFIQHGDIVFKQPILSKNEVCALSLIFLGLPYTWGGRSSFGYDCSGFVQMLYGKMGIHLPRDSKDQVLVSGFDDVGLDRLTAGDLVFFGFSDGAIKHVGLCLGNGRFIHACASVENAPYVRISSLTDPAWDGTGYYPYRIGRTRRR